MYWRGSSYRSSHMNVKEENLTNLKEDSPELNLSPLRNSYHACSLNKIVGA